MAKIKISPHWRIGNWTWATPEDCDRHQMDSERQLIHRLEQKLSRTTARHRRANYTRRLNNARVRLAALILSQP
jgi:hypothetical protein